MTSAIDATKPIAGSPTTLSVRTNFATAASEITALQATDATHTANIAALQAGTVSNVDGTANGLTVGTGTFATLSNNVAQETVQASKPTTLYLKDGTLASPNSTSTNPALWIAKYVSASQTTESSQQVSGAFIDVEVSGSGNAASPTKGAYIGLLASVNTKGSNTGTNVAPTWDTKGDTVGIAGFARNTGVPQDGHIITGVWGWAQAPTLDATTYANLAAANWSIAGCEVNLTLHGQDIGVKTSLNGNGSSVGYLANNYRAPSAGVLDWTFGMVLAGTPNDGNYSSTDIANWNGYRTGILIDKIKNYGINFGTYYANSSYCIKFADTYAGSTEPAAAIYLGNNKINLGQYTGSTWANNDFWENGGSLFFRTGGTTYTVVNTGTSVTATGGSSGRTLAARAGDRLTPQDFGAVGDGSTDDTAAVASWWTYIAANGVAGYVPKGTYKLVGQVTWDIPSGSRTKGVKIEGAGPQYALFNLTTTSSPALQIKCSSGATFYNTFRDFGISTNLSGTGVRIGLADFSDPFNSSTFDNLVINNTSTNAAAIGLETNYLANSHVNAVVNCGAATAAAAVKVNHSVFCEYRGAHDTALIGTWIATDYTYGCTFQSIDYEVVATCVQIDSANATKNTWLGGTFVYTGSFAITGNAGSSNLFISPNISGSGSNASGSGIVIMAGDGTFSGVGGTMLSMGNVASAVNNFKFFPAATAGAPALAATGSDSNIAVEWRSKGTGRQFFTTGGGTQFEITSVASAVNYLSTNGAATGNRPSLLATGSDSNVGITAQTKGTGSFVFKTQAGSSNALVVLDNGAAVSTNYPEFTPAASGSPVLLKPGASSADANSGMTVSALGTGTLTLGLSTGLIAHATYVSNSESGGLTAAGNSQGTALALTSTINIITTAAASTGVLLPAATNGVEIIVINRGANTLSVYPPTSGQIDATAVNGAVTIVTNSKARYMKTATNQWYTV